MASNIAVASILFCYFRLTSRLSMPMILVPSATQHPSEIHATVGGNVTLRCPVPFKTDFISWTKADEPDQRLELSKRHHLSSRGGILRIYSVVVGDSAEYICKASGGHGPQEEKVTLRVHDIPEYSRENLNNHYPEHAETGKPRFRLGKPLFSWFQRQVGSSVRFRCEAKGRPQMKVHWWKDHRVMRSPRRSLWTLALLDLKESDSGLYTCVVSNELGSISANFSLQVVDVTGEKPELLGNDPLNATLTYGSTATLQCRSRSKTPQHIQWLKKILDTESLSPDDRRLSNENEYYRVLKNHQSVPVSPAEEGIYLSKLQLGPVTEEMAGKYICVAHNVQGLFTYKAAYVDVETPPREVEEASAGNSVLTSALVAVFVLVLFILLRFSVVLYRRFCSSATKTSVPKSESTSQHQEPLVVEEPPLQTTAVPSLTRLGSVPTRHKHYHHHQHRHQHHLLSENGRTSKTTRAVVI